MPGSRLRRWLYLAETTAIVAAGLVSALRAYAYLPPLTAADVPSLSAFTRVLPLWVYAAMWFCVLPMSLSTIWVRKMWAPTLLTFAGLSAFSGVVSVASWITNDGADRGWVGALSYVLLAVFIAALGFIASIAERQQVLIDSMTGGSA